MQAARTRASAFGCILALTCVVLALAPAAQGAGKPDLAALSVAPPSAGLSILSADEVVVVVRNGGRGVARRPAVTLLLSSDRKKSASDRVVGSGTLKALRGHARVSAAVHSVVPPTVAAGSYYLLACVAASGQSQASTKNDCAATKARVSVRAAATVVRPHVQTFEPLPASATIGPAGGVLSTKAGDGSTITLTIPKKALVSFAQIRLVPAAVTPGPAGLAPLVAAIVQPEGLAVPGATIEFQTPGTPRNRLGAFVFGGEDEAIARSPFLPGGSVRIDVGILGGYGVGTRSGAQALRQAAGSTVCLQGSARAAADTCQVESLRKRWLQIFSGDTGSGEVLGEWVTFERETLLPAIDSAIATEGVPGAELDDMISILVSSFEQFGLPGAKELAAKQVAGSLQKAAAKSLAACVGGKQGAVATAAQIGRLANYADRLGRALPGSIYTDFAQKCLTRPYYVSYEMSASGRGDSDFAPWLESGTAKAFDVPVLAPPAGASASRALIFSGLVCDPGGNDSCEVSDASGGLTAEILRSEWKSREQERCGRTVNVPELQLVLQLRHAPQDTVTTHFCKDGDCLDAPFAGAFDGALTVSTDGESQQVTLPESGGQTGISGADDFMGLHVTGYGSVKLSLLPGG